MTVVGTSYNRACRPFERGNCIRVHSLFRLFEMEEFEHLYGFSRLSRKRRGQASSFGITGPERRLDASSAHFEVKEESKVNPAAPER